MKKFLLMIIPFVCLFACKKNEDPAPGATSTTTLLTFKQDDPASTANADNWIFATDENGNILDIQHYEGDQTVVLKSDKVKASDKINITIFRYFNPAGESVDFISYLGITPTQTWLYNKRLPSFPTQLGSATLNFTNTPASPLNPGITVTNNLTFNSTRPTKPNSVTAGLYKIPEKLLAIANIGDVPKYLEWTNVVDGATRTADYPTSFIALQNNFTFSIPASEGCKVIIYGIMNQSGVDPGYVTPTSSIGYLNCSMSINAGAGSIQWGYNNGYDVYNTFAGRYAGKVTREYHKLGTPVSTFSFANHTFTATNASLNGYTFSLSGDYQVRNSRWLGPIAGMNAVLSWSVYSAPGSSQKFLKIPDEIKNAHPELDMTTLTLKDNTFNVYLDGFTYLDLLNGQMNISTSKKPYSTEYQTITIVN